MQESIEACLDIGNHIIVEKGFQKGEDYKDIFRVLENEGIIDTGLSSWLQEMAQFRNLFVHRYGEIDVRRLFIARSEDLKDIKEFIRKILDYIS